VKKAWLVSLILHGTALLALLRAPQAPPRAARLVDVDWLESASGSRPAAKRDGAAVRSAVAREIAFHSPAAEAPADGATGGGRDRECESCAGIVEYRPAPPYPEDAQEAGLEGEILVEIKTDEEGFVKNVELVKSSGHAVLDLSVLNTVKTWRLRPLKTVRVPVSFHLES